MSSVNLIDIDGNYVQGRAKRSTGTLTDENTYVYFAPLTSQARRPETEYARGYFNFLAQGTFGATLHLQRSFDDGVTYYDVTDGTFTANVNVVMFEPRAGVRYRAGFPTGQNPTSVYIEFNQ